MAERGVRVCEWDGEGGVGREGEEGVGEVWGWRGGGRGAGGMAGGLLLRSKVMRLLQHAAAGLHAAQLPTCLPVCPPSLLQRWGAARGPLLATRWWRRPRPW